VRRPPVLPLPAIRLAGSLLLTASLWVAFWSLFHLPHRDAEGTQVLYLIGPFPSWRWGTLCFVAASVASLVCGAQVIVLAFRRSTTRAARVLISALGTVVWSAAACYLGVVCFVLFLADGFAGEQWVVTAQDGTRLMITQDGFDGDVVDFYAHRQGWEWARRPESAKVDPRQGPCTLVVKNETTLTVTCGSAHQDVSRPSNR
jgi:hypothetical protein